ncbi:GNAT family N-acetyltransferase [Marisediminicola senii]|uniref:GNAT family N-acetyltransferase n=1 Tax=Marisediminicola senii TaxID=2711233 RepID=UPI0013ED3123|nr:GNAT family N-acetyltransferase [Marisediminicola senii]
MRLARIADDRFAEWMRRASAAYIEARVRAGETHEMARAKADADWEALFPGGQPQAQHHVMDIVEDEAPAGWIWVGPANPGAGVDWWLWDIFVKQDRRGRGLAAAAIHQAEELAREHGVTSIGLNVFGYNDTARELYARLGYATVATQMKKLL